MSFTRVNPSGWVARDLLTAAQMNPLDIDHANAVDGAAGGTYAPSSALIINGSGLQVGGSGLTVTAYPTLSSTTVTRVQPLAHMQGDTGNGATVPTDLWFYRDKFAWMARTAACQYRFPVTNIPDKATWTKARLIVSGAVISSHAALPTFGSPQMEVEYLTSSLTVTELGNATDPSGTVGAFNAVHSIESTFGAPLAIDQTATPLTAFVVFIAPSGGNFEADKFGVLRLECDFTITKLTPG